MRGKGTAQYADGSKCRITPAHAGKRRCRQTRTAACQDHPRACGEKSAAIAFFARETGSPPRMRGKGRACKRRNGGGRITPAHAGKRKTKVAEGTISWDHPRACGEKTFRPSRSACAVGSPPRMRGKVERTRNRSIIFRITPAHAGKSKMSKRL